MSFCQFSRYLEASFNYSDHFMVSYSLHIRINPLKNVYEMCSELSTFPGAKFGCTSMILFFVVRPDYLL